MILSSKIPWTVSNVKDPKSSPKIGYATKVSTLYENTMTILWRIRWTLAASLEHLYQYNDFTSVLKRFFV